MSNDIRFIQRLPASFIENNRDESGEPGLFRFIRDADADHDYTLTREEIRRALPADIAQNNLDRSVEEIERSCEFVRNTLRAGHVELHGIRRDVQLFSPRHPMGRLIPQSRNSNVHYTWGHTHFDADQNLRIDRAEILAQMRNSLPTRRDILENRLRSTAEGVYRMEAASRHRGLMNLLNIATWLPMHIIPGVPDNLHDQIRISAQARHDIRLQTINRFMEHLNAHPEESVQDALGSLSPQDQNILIDDLQVQNWQYVLSSANSAENIDAHLTVAEYFMQGADSTYTLGGARTALEFVIVPWRAENYAMAHDIVTALESTPGLSPQQSARLAELRTQISSPNQLIIQSLPPADSQAQGIVNKMVRGALDLIELPRPLSLNETWDFIATAAIELLLLKGSVRMYRIGRAALGARLGATTAGLGARLGPMGGVAEWFARRFLGYTGRRAIVEASLAAGSVAATGAAMCSSGVCANQSSTLSNIANTCAPLLSRVNQVSPSFVRRAFSAVGTVLGTGLQLITVGGASTMVQNIVIPPERHNTETDSFQISQPDLENGWIDANLASLALALYQIEHPVGS